MPCTKKGAHAAAASAAIPRPLGKAEKRLRDGLTLDHRVVVGRVGRLRRRHRAERSERVAEQHRVAERDVEVTHELVLRQPRLRHGDISQFLVASSLNNYA